MKKMYGLLAGSTAALNFLTACLAWPRNEASKSEARISHAARGQNVRVELLQLIDEFCSCSILDPLDVENLIITRGKS